MNPYRRKAYVLLLSVSLIWGVASAVIKFTLGGIGPLPFLTYRFFLATVAAFLFLPYFHIHFQKIKDNFLEIFIYSFITTTIALGLLFLGLSKTTLLDTVLITAVSPLITAVAGVLLLNEHISRQEKTGIALAFFGTLITIVDPLFKNGVHLVSLTGNLLVVGYLVVNALSSVLAKKLARKDISSFALSNISFIIGFITIAPLTFAATSPSLLMSTIKNLPLQYHLGVIYMAFISGTLAYALWIKGQKSIEVSEAGLFAYLVPVFSAPLAIFWLGETVTLPFILGAILITAGVIVAEYKRRS